MDHLWMANAFQMFIDRILQSCEEFVRILVLPHIDWVPIIVLKRTPETGWVYNFPQATTHSDEDIPQGFKDWRQIALIFFHGQR